MQESWNFTEVSEEFPRPVNEKQAQEISSIRRKARTLEMDMDDLINDVVKLSQNSTNKIKAQLRVERLTDHRESYL